MRRAYNVQSKRGHRHWDLLGCAHSSPARQLIHTALMRTSLLMGTNLTTHLQTGIEPNRENAEGVLKVRRLDVCPTQTVSRVRHRVPRARAPHAAVERATATEYGTLGTLGTWASTTSASCCVSRGRPVSVVSTSGSFGAHNRSHRSPLSGLSRQQSTLHGAGGLPSIPSASFDVPMSMSAHIWAGRVRE